MDALAQLPQSFSPRANAEVDGTVGGGKLNSNVIMLYCPYSSARISSLSVAESLKSRLICDATLCIHYLKRWLGSVEQGVESLLRGSSSRHARPPCSP